jgi:hypothetical protein
MDYEGERDFAIENIQRFAWRRFSAELLRTAQAPSYSALREYLRDFEGTRMVGPMFDAARMGPVAFDLDERLRSWYAEWAAGRYLEPIQRPDDPSDKGSESNRVEGQASSATGELDAVPLHKQTEVVAATTPVSEADFDWLMDEMVDDPDEDEAEKDEGEVEPVEVRLRSLEKQIQYLENRFYDFTVQLKVVALLVVVIIVGTCFYR